ncbi:lipopolysaccharide biosynthesis protein [Flavisphingomonas formosensis]|uniref:lipopolysaccharide biosynthesis protein n=1 Tax=Flavisphingomonas formosensis TaxID=861534 RepID=UPI0012FC6A0B|nr:hypothetical protein [Sphingomonas formosensis]
MSTAAKIQERLRHHMPSIVALGLRGTALLAGFVITYFIGHKQGPAANGQYALVTQTAMFLSTAGLAGIDIAVVRHFPAALTRKMPIALSTFIKVSFLSIMLMVGIGLALWATGDVLWQPLVGHAVPKSALLVLSVLLIGRGGSRLFGAVLRSQHVFTLGQIVEVSIIPVAVALLLAAGMLHTPGQALWATAIASIAATVIGLLACLRYVGMRGETLSVPMKNLLHSSLPLWGVYMSINAVDWFTLTLAATYLNASGAGIYRVAVQAAGLMQVISISLYSIYPARISASFHAGDLAWTGRLTRSATRVSALCAAPIALVLLIFPERLLAIIGPEFIACAPVVRILVIGQLINTLIGPAGMTLAMSGNERLNLIISIGGTGLMFLAAPFATKYGGLEGLATSITTIMILRNVVSLFFVSRLLGLNVATGKVRPVKGGKPKVHTPPAGAAAE